MTNEATNKLTIVLNDKNLIAELLKDKDVRVRIADAVIDGIARRALKLDGMKERIADAARKQIEGEFLSGNIWRPTLNPQYQDLINKQVKSYIDNEVYKTLMSTREEAITAIKSAIKEATSEDVLNKMIQNAIYSEVKRRFSL